MELDKKEQVLRDDLTRVLMYRHLYRISLMDIASSDKIKEWAQKAKAIKNKSFIDLREPAAAQVRSLDAFYIKLKAAMSAETFTLINTNMNSEQSHEINLIVEMLADLENVEDIRKKIEKAVKKAEDNGK